MSKSKTDVVVVTYELQLAGDPPPEPEWEAPPSYTGERKRKWLADQPAKWANSLAAQPYTGTFKAVHMRSWRKQNGGLWEAKKGAMPPALSAKHWLLQHYPQAWATSLLAENRWQDPPVTFIGFNVKLFIKMLGLECSLPSVQSQEPKGTPQLPLAVWYESRGYRDLTSAVMSDFKFLDWPLVLQRRGLQEQFAGWTGPGDDVQQDMRLAICLASQLGMFEPAP